MSRMGFFQNDTIQASNAATVGLHVYKSDGYWSIERLRNGEIVEAYVGVLTVADALDRIGEWLRGDMETAVR